MTKYTPICHTCSEYEGRKTLKNTIMLKYGVKNYVIIISIILFIPHTTSGLDSFFNIVVIKCH